MRIDVLTLFPEMFGPVLDASIVGRARAAGLVTINLINIRDYTTNKHNKVDDRPFGGGPGMVMACQPVWDAVLAAESAGREAAGGEAEPIRILMTPQGWPLTQAIVDDLAKQPWLLVIAGHYEGIDERVIERLDPLELSVGDYVLSGGELPAMTLIDAVVRLLPGALGHDESAAEDSFATRSPDGLPLLDCPHYTRPRVWEGREAPEVLLSGDHAAIDRWRLEQRLKRTAQRRPDLLQGEDKGKGESGHGRN